MSPFHRVFTFQVLQKSANDGTERHWPAIELWNDEQQRNSAVNLLLKLKMPAFNVITANQASDFQACFDYMTTTLAREQLPYIRHYVSTLAMSHLHVPWTDVVRHCLELKLHAFHDAFDGALVVCQERRLRRQVTVAKRKASPIERATTAKITRYSTASEDVHVDDANDDKDDGRSAQSETVVVGETAQAYVAIELPLLRDLQREKIEQLQFEQQLHALKTTFDQSILGPRPHHVARL